MGLLQFGDVFQNFLGLAIIFGVLFMIYRSMRAGKAKESITNLFDKMRIREEK